MLDSEKIAALEQRLQYQFRSRELLERALTHSSRAYEEQPDKSDRGNEQMEFLGDAVLGLAAADWLFRHYADKDEGHLTRHRAALVSRRNLSRVARRVNLGEYLRLGRGEERSGGRHKAALLADALEAVIAAVYLDGGMEAAAALVGREIMLDPQAIEEQDAKSALQEWLQARGRDAAEYNVLSAEGPDHKKMFTIELRLNGEPLAQATAGSKKQAEQQCAREALEQLQAISS